MRGSADFPTKNPLRQRGTCLNPLGVGSLLPAFNTERLNMQKFIREN